MEIIMFTTSYVLEDITKYMWYEMEGKHEW